MRSYQNNDTRVGPKVSLLDRITLVNGGPHGVYLRAFLVCAGALLLCFFIFTQAVYAEWSVNRSVSTRRGQCLIESEKFSLDQGIHNIAGAQAYFIITPQSITLRTTLLIDPAKSNVQIDAAEPFFADKVTLGKFLVFESQANEIIQQMKSGKTLKVHVRTPQGGLHFSELDLKDFSTIDAERQTCQQMPVL